MPIDYTKGRPQPASAQPTASQPTASQPAPGAGVSLSKVTLTKNSPTVSLSKQQGGSAGGFPLGQDLAGSRLLERIHGAMHGVWLHEDFR